MGTIGVNQLLLALKRRVKTLTQTKEERRHALVGPASLWELKRDFQISFLKDMGLENGHYLFEIGCGILRGGIPIIEYLDVGHYFGCEVREAVLDEAWKELGDEGLEGKDPTLLLSQDISKLIIDRNFDYIWAFSVLIHMSDDILNDTLTFVSRHLSRNGVFYANVNVGERKEGNWQGFPIVARTLDFYRQACARNGLVVSNLGTLKDFGHISNVALQDNQWMIGISHRS